MQRLGGCEKIDEEKALDEALSLAAKADAVLFVGGLSPEWESEGFDRPTLQLPGRQDELITRVSQVNKNTIVCLQTVSSTIFAWVPFNPGEQGSAVSMPWAESVSAILQAWYSGNESGNAIADVIYGRVNPAGRLPLTFPVRIEDTPAHLNQVCENGKIQ